MKWLHGKEQEHNALVINLGPMPSCNAHCLGWLQCNQNVVGFRFRNIDVTNHLLMLRKWKVFKWW